MTRSNPQLNLLPPFARADELNADLIINTSGEAVASSQPARTLSDTTSPTATITRRKQKGKDGKEATPGFLPGNPRMLLAPEAWHDFAVALQSEFLTPELNSMSPHLWLVAPNSSAQISPLHHQIVCGRHIIITEKPSLHLLWDYTCVYIKPIPEYLMSHAFWEYYIASDGSPLRLNERRDLWAAASGFLRSYYHLIQHPSDFLLAQKDDHRLLPPDISFSDFCEFIRPFGMIDDEDVSGRYRFGEVRQKRVNLWAWILLYNHSGSIADLAKFYGALLFVFSLVSVALSAMQLELAVQQVAPLDSSQPWASFTSASRGFSVCTLIIILSMVLLFIAVPVIEVLRELYFSLRGLYMPRNRQLRKRNEFAMTAARSSPAVAA